MVNGGSFHFFPAAKIDSKCGFTQKNAIQNVR
jgi:hypothetical protein